LIDAIKLISTKMNHHTHLADHFFYDNDCLFK